MVIKILHSCTVCTDSTILHIHVPTWLTWTKPALYGIYSVCRFMVIMKKIQSCRNLTNENYASENFHLCYATLSCPYCFACEVLNVFTFLHDMEVMFKCVSMVNQCSLCASSILLPTKIYTHVRVGFSCMAFTCSWWFAHYDCTIWVFSYSTFTLNWSV